VAHIASLAAVSRFHIIIIIIALVFILLF